MQRIAKDFNCAPNRETASSANPQKDWQAHSENPALWGLQRIAKKTKRAFFCQGFLRKGSLNRRLGLSCGPDKSDSQIDIRSVSQSVRLSDSRTARHPYSQTARQTSRQADSLTVSPAKKQTGRQPDSQTARQSDQADSQTARQPDSQTVRQSVRRSVSQRDRQTARQSDKQTSRPTGGRQPAS